jgi:hypothetical protein
MALLTISGKTWNYIDLGANGASPLIIMCFSHTPSIL